MVKKKKSEQSATGRAATNVSPSGLLRAEIERGTRVPSHLLVAAGIAIVTWIVLKVCTDNQFTGWDDPGYLSNNALIKSISAEGCRKMFSVPVMGNYHPLTILSYAIEYSFVKLEPWLYHFDNLVFHILLTLLVYWLTLLLTRRTAAAVVAALLFGLHPMHVESVAWASGRKDVLYGIFYVASCIAYVYYIRSSAGAKKSGLYALVILMFLLALLSKPVAVSLPLSLLLIDYFEKKEWKASFFIDKIPHFLLAIFFGILAIKMQHVAGAMDMNKVVYNPIERVALGAYALCTYLWKAIIPIGLHNLYPYPQKVGGQLPYVYYLYPLVIAVVAFAIWRFERKNRVVVFGVLFFMVNIILLLQFIPVGDAIVAERYGYIPYLGLFFIAGWFVSGLFEAGKLRRYVSIAVAGCAGYIGYLGYLSHDQCMVWYDEISLWRNEIENEPNRVPQAYNNLGYTYYLKWTQTADPAEKKLDYDSAYYLINMAIAVRPDYRNPYIALGEMLRTAGKFDEGKKLYHRGLQMVPDDDMILSGLAILFFMNSEYDSSGYYFKKVVQLHPSPESYGNYGNYFEVINHNDSALLEYNKSIALGADINEVLYLNRGKLFKKLGRWDDAQKDFEKGIFINPDKAEPYYLRSMCFAQKGNKALALRDMEKAIALGYRDFDKNYYQSLKK
jgi:protein O-mannosyl-transferase